MESRIGQQCGNYRLTHLLGQGGFADVYLGEHIYLKTYAALKILRMQLTNDVKEDFLREAQAVASLEHPHIVRILECGFEGQVPFLVMTYAPNGSLRQRYPRGSRLPLELVVSYVQQVASALHYAHERRMIHRDIKPENMLLGYANDMLLSDFGVVSFVQSTSSQTTKDMAGTIPYMAPEQLRGKPQPASDQYALGIVVYEWLSGMRPFQGSFAEIASQHLLASPPPLSGNVPGVSPEIERVIFTALAKEPQQRFNTVQAFATALEQAYQLTAPHPFAPGSVSTTTSWRPPAQGIQLPSRAQPSVDIFSQGSYPPQQISTVTPSPSGLLSRGSFSVSPSVAQLFPAAPLMMTTPQNQVQTQHVSGMNNPVTWLLLAACVGSGLLLFSSYASRTLTLSNMWTFLIVVVVALASLLIRLKVNRFNVFVKRIEAFPEAERVKAMRTELNAVTPPEMTAEQFIKFKQHPYNFAFKCLVMLLLAGLLSIILFNFGVYRLYIAPILTNAHLSSTTLSATPTPPSSIASFVPSTWHETIDPMSDNSKGYGWQETDNIYLGCHFKDMSYQITEYGGGGSVASCMAQNTFFSDVGYEVTLKVAKDIGGGIAFRSGKDGDYYFSVVYQNNIEVLATLKICAASCTTLKSIPSDAIYSLFHKGQGQTNNLAVIAKGNTFTLFINDVSVAQVTDSTFTRGLLGIGVGTATQQISYSGDVATAVKIWTP